MTSKREEGPCKTFLHHSLSHRTSSLEVENSRRETPPPKKIFFLEYAEQAAAFLALLLVLLPDSRAATCCLDLSYLICSAQSISPIQACREDC